MEIKCKCKQPECNLSIRPFPSVTGKTYLFEIINGNRIEYLRFNRTDAAALIKALKKFIGKEK